MSAKTKNTKEKPKYSNIFQYFDDNFYDFLNMTSRGKSNKRIRFKNRIIKTMTPNDAFLLKKYIDDNGLKYQLSRSKQLLDNAGTIEYILNVSRGNIKSYKYKKK